MNNLHHYDGYTPSKNQSKQDLTRFDRYADENWSLKSVVLRNMEFRVTFWQALGIVFLIGVFCFYQYALSYAACS